MKLKTGEKGFTLLELLVGIAIAVFVVGAASMTVITMMRLTPRTNNWAIALRQVQNAGYWISRDVMMSDTVTPGTGDTFLTLIVPYESGVNIDKKEIVYYFGKLDGELNSERWLIRTDSTGGLTPIAKYIYEPIQYDPPDPAKPYTLTFTITATLGNTDVNRAEVIRQYEATQRVPASAPAP